MKSQFHVVVLLEALRHSLVTSHTPHAPVSSAVIWICVEGWVVWVVGVWCGVPCLVCGSFVGVLCVWLFVIILWVAILSLRTCVVSSTHHRPLRHHFRGLAVR